MRESTISDSVPFSLAIQFCQPFILLKTITLVFDEFTDHFHKLQYSWRVSKAFFIPSKDSEKIMVSSAYSKTKKMNKGMKCVLYLFCDSTKR